MPEVDHQASANSLRLAAPLFRIVWYPSKEKTSTQARTQQHHSRQAMSRQNGSRFGNRHIQQADRFLCTGLIHSIEEAYDNNDGRFVIHIHLKHNGEAILPLPLNAYIGLYPALQEMRMKSIYLRYVHHTAQPGRPATNSIDLNSVAPHNTEKVQRKHRLAWQAMMERLGNSKNAEELYNYIRRRSGKK